MSCTTDKSSKGGIHHITGMSITGKSSKADNSGESGGEGKW